MRLTSVAVAAAAALTPCGRTPPTAPAPAPAYAGACAPTRAPAPGSAPEAARAPPAPPRDVRPLTTALRVVLCMSASAPPPLLTPDRAAAAFAPRAGDAPELSRESNAAVVSPRIGRADAVREAAAYAASVSGAEPYAAPAAAAAAGESAASATRRGSRRAPRPTAGASGAAPRRGAAGAPLVAAGARPGAPPWKETPLPFCTPIADAPAARASGFIGARPPPSAGAARDLVVSARSVLSWPLVRPVCARGRSGVVTPTRGRARPSQCARLVDEAGVARLGDAYGERSWLAFADAEAA